MPAGDSLEPLWDLGELPFHIGPRQQPSNGALPDRLRFTVGLDARSGRIVQMPDAAVEDALGEAYREGAQIGTPLSESGPGQRGLEDFVRFIERVAARRRLEGLTILEIGSGGGAVLRALHARGAKVVGVEPGAPEDPDLPFPVLREPFRAELFDSRFDLIVHHGVAEHVPDPVAFMAEQLSLLDPAGAIAFTVPDCAPAIAHGDISMLVHEHWSYFTEETLANVAALAGARVVSSEPAGVAGARHSVWTALDTPPGLPSPVPDRWFADRSFADRAAGNLERLGERLGALRAGGAQVGIYCPARFINYQALLADSLPALRYFDDDPRLEGLFYPPYELRVEPRARLLAEPPTHVIVVSWTFGAEISRSLREEQRLEQVHIQTIADLLPA